MAARSFQIALGAAAVRLSDVYEDGVGVVNAAKDVPYRQIQFSAQGAAAYVGGRDQVVTNTTFGLYIEVDIVEGLGPFETGPVKLSDFYAAGAGATLHILAIPF